MTSYGTFPQKAFLCQLEDTLATELKAVLAHRTIGLEVEICSTLSECRRKLKDLQQQPQMVFCKFSEDFAVLRHTLQAQGSRIPIVVVSRHPNAMEWLDSMDAGAADYCAAPFELPHIRWIVNTNRKPQMTTAA